MTEDSLGLVLSPQTDGLSAHRAGTPRDSPLPCQPNDSFQVT